MAVNHYWYRNSQAHIFKVVGSGRVNNSRLCPGAKRSGERVHNALHCGMLAVLDFDPMQRTAGRGASRRCPPAPSDKRGGTGQGQSRPARSRSGRYRPHAAPAAVRGWPCASTAAGRGDPRHRSPGCRRRRTRPRHIEDEGGVAVTQRMAAAVAMAWCFPICRAARRWGAPSTRLCGTPWRRPANGRKPRPRLRLDAHRAFIVEVAAGGAFTPDLGLRRALP